MAIELRSTQGLASNGVKILVYGESKVGKTTLAATLPNPVILTAETGLLSLAGYELPFYELNPVEHRKRPELMMPRIQEVYHWLLSGDGRDFESVVLDSISEVADVILAACLARNKDGRAAYGEMMQQVEEVVRMFRDLPGVNVYFIAQADRIQDEAGKLRWCPSMPGKSLGPSLPYFFDEVLPLRIVKDSEGNDSRWLQTSIDENWVAGDRSGKLDIPWEAPDLGAVIRKIRGEG